MPGEQLQNALGAEPAETPVFPQAWQPLTPRGIAAFAGASFGRLFIVEMIVALLAAALAVWFLYAAWFPGIAEAIRHLPAQGLIDYGELKWPGKAFEVVHERRPFVAFIVDIEGQSRGNPGTDLSLHFRKHQCQLWSPLGRLFFPYPREYQIEFNRPELEPRWGAWAPIFLGLVVVAVPISLLSIWAVLASLYFGPGRLLAFFTNRQVTWGGSWRLASAALLPGALLFMAAILLYGLRGIDFWHLVLAFALHILAGWVFLVLGTLQLPLLPANVVVKGNPFESLTTKPEAPVISQQEGNPVAQPTAPNAPDENSV